MPLLRAVPSVSIVHTCRDSPRAIAAQSTEFGARVRAPFWVEDNGPVTVPRCGTNESLSDRLVDGALVLRFATPLNAPVTEINSPHPATKQLPPDPEADRAETAREKSEDKRADAETGRAAAETERNSEEVDRSDAELSRRLAEERREFRDWKRTESERARAEAESTRLVAEQARLAAELARETAEDARAAAESARAEAAELRQNDADQLALMQSLHRRLRDLEERVTLPKAP